MMDQEGTTNLVGELGSPPNPNLLSISADAEGSSDQRPSSQGVGRQATMYSRLTRDSMISIGVVDHHSFTRGCITRSLTELDNKVETIPFTTYEECLESTSNIDLILYHIRQSSPYGGDNDTQLAPLKKLMGMPPVIILSAVDSPELIIEAFENGARGYIPTTSTSLELAIEIIRMVRAGGTFVPPSGLCLRRINRKDPTARAIMNHEFTPRQMAVLSYLTRGKANKAIAHELAMSESTVKVHIRNIMKKMNATNRTEVACLAHVFDIGEHA